MNQTTPPHQRLVQSIVDHSRSLVILLIAWLGQAMGMPPQASSTKCRRQDSYRVFREISLRYPTGQGDKFGNEIMKHFRNDLVAIIRPGRYGLNQAVAFSVGLEVKATKEDLLANSEKTLCYLGWTDFYFIVVPSWLGQDAIKIAAMLDDRIGVILIASDGYFSMLKKPVRQHVLAENRRALDWEMLFAGAGATAGIDYSNIQNNEYAQDAASGAELHPARYIEVDPVLIRKDFAGLHETYRNHIITK